MHSNIVVSLTGGMCWPNRSIATYSLVIDVPRSIIMILMLIVITITEYYDALYHS